MSAGLSTARWRQSPMRRFLRRAWQWALMAWIVLGWMLVIPAWAYLQ